MRIKPLSLTFIALCLGISLGLLVLNGQRYITHELLSLLDTEAQNAGNYHLTWGEASMTFFPLRATARNVSLVDGEKVSAHFKRLEADFDISDLWSKSVDLTELRIYDGVISGIGYHSAIYRFIDRLTSDSDAAAHSEKAKKSKNSQESKEKPGWRLNLIKLTLFPTQVEQNFLGIPLKAEQAVLRMVRSESGNYILSANLPRVIPAVTEPRLNAASASATMELSRDELNFRTLEIRLPGGTILTRGQIPVTKYGKYQTLSEGSFNVGEILSEYSLLSNPRKVVSESTKKTSYTEGTLRAEGSFTGESAEPQVSIKLENSSALKVGTEESNIVFEKLALLLKGSFFEDSYDLEVREAEGSGLVLSAKDPIKIRGENVSGVLHVVSPAYTLFAGFPTEMQLSDLEADVKLGGTFLKPLLGLEADAIVPLIGRTHVEASNVGSTASFEAWTADRQMRAQGRVLLDGIPRLVETTITTDLAAPDSVLQNARINGEIEIGGPLTLNQLHADGTVQVVRAGGEILKAEGSLSQGKISLSIADPLKTIQVAVEDLLTDDRPGKIDIQAERFNGLALISGKASSCAMLTGKGVLGLAPHLSGLPTGIFRITNATLGCAPYVMEAKDPVSLEVSKSAITIPSITFQSAQGTLIAKLALNGITESQSPGVQAEISGSSDLKNILPLLPELDDLSGIIAVDAKISGSLQEPRSTGTLTIANGAFSAADGLLVGDDFKGSLALNEKALRIESLSGRLNDGNVTIHGDSSLAGAGELHLQAKGVSIAPSLSSSFTIASDLHATLQPFALAGTLTVTQGIVEENIELFNLLRGNTSQSRKPTVFLQEALARLPFKIDIAVTGDRSVALNSNLIGTDVSLNGRIHTERHSSKDDNSFSLDFNSDSGWILLGDKRFDIRRAFVSIGDKQSDPQLELQAEALIRTREGDIALIRATASGSLNEPQIKLSSDRGLRQREILTLLTSGSGLLTEGRFGTLQQNFSLDPLEFFDDDLLFGLGGWVKRLSRIDSLAFEPAFNPQRGTIDPTVVASKRLIGNLTLVGRSTFSSGNPEASAELRNPLTSSVEGRLIAQSFPAQSNNAFEGFLAYSALSGEELNTKIQVSSDSRWASEGLNLMLEQRLGQRLTREDLPLVSQRTSESLLKEGYFEANVISVCIGQQPLPNGKVICKQVKVTVDRGKQSIVKKRRLVSSRPLNGKLKKMLGATLASVRYPSSAMLAAAESEMLQALRMDGYALARCQLEYEVEDKRLVAHINPSKRYELFFGGAQIFSAEDFLGSINYFKSPRSFGTTFISLLLEGMESLYSKRGFPLATFSVDSQEDAEKVSVNISVDEGPQLSKEQIDFIGLKTVSEAEVIQWMRAADKKTSLQILSGNSLSKEQSVESLKFVEGVFALHGFSSAKAQLRYANSSDTAVFPQITVEEGAREKLLAVTSPELPSGVLWTAPASVFEGQVEAMTRQLENALQVAGYLQPEIEFSQNTEDVLVLKVKPQLRTSIRSVTFEYNGPVADEVLLSTLNLHAGDPWDEKVLEQAQRRMFALGLFRKVALEAADGALDQSAEDLKVVLDPQQPRFLTLGIGANSEFGTHLQAAYLDRGIFLDGRTISGQMDSYFGYSDGKITKGVVSMAYNDPAVFHSDTGYVSDFRFQRLSQDTLPFDLDRLTLSNYLHQSWELEDFASGITATLGHSILFEDLSNVNPGAIIDRDLDANQNILSFLSATAAVDARDDALLPMSGWAASLTNQLSSTVLGSETNFYIADGRISFIAPLDEVSSKLSLASATRGAFGISYGKDEILPLSQRFFAGGRNSVRGFKENSLGPRSADGTTVQGGDLLAVQNLELRYLLGDGLQLNTFLDAGGVFQQQKSIEVRDIRRSTGIGMRYLSPIGPIGFDLGFPLDERPGESSVRFHFTIGSNF